MSDSLDPRDFQDFQKSTADTAPDRLDERISQLVSVDLTPSHSLVFAKLLGVQAFIGCITMFFCPQFELSWTGNLELFHYFHHKYGEAMCMVICGTIFMGSGAAFAAYLLKHSEIRLVVESKFLYYISISAIFLGFFFIFGAEFYLNLVAFWLIGAVGSAVFLFEVGRYARFWLATRG